MMKFAKTSLTSVLERQTCLSPRAKVLIHGKGYLQACDIRPGDLLTSASGHGDSPGGTLVEGVKQLVATSFVVINGAIEITDSHPFLRVNRQWTTAGELLEGDLLAGLDGPEMVTSLARSVRSPEMVLDILTSRPFLVGEFATISKQDLLASGSVGIGSNQSPILYPAQVIWAGRPVHSI